MKVEHFILAKGSSIDRDTQVLSVFEIIEQMQIQSPKFPVNVPVHAVIVFRREEEQGVLVEPWRLSVTDGSKKTLLSQNLEVKMESDHLRQRVRVHFPIQITHDGTYQVQITHVNQTSNSRVLEVDVKAITDISRKPLPHI